MLRGSLHRWEAGRFFILFFAVLNFWSWRALRDLLVLNADILQHIAVKLFPGKHNFPNCNYPGGNSVWVKFSENIHGEQVILVPFLRLHHFPKVPPHRAHAEFGRRTSAGEAGAPFVFNFIYAKNRSRHPKAR